MEYISSTPQISESHSQISAEGKIKKGASLELGGKSATHHYRLRHHGATYEQRAQVIGRAGLSAAQLDALPPEKQITMRGLHVALRVYAVSLTRNREDANDLCSETLLKAWRALQCKQYHPVSDIPFRAYLHKTMYHLFISSLRHRRSLSKMDVYAVLDEVVEPIQEGGSLLLGPVMMAMTKLAPEEQHALIAVGQALPYNEVAKELGVTVRIVANRMGRGRRALRALLEMKEPL